MNSRAAYPPTARKNPTPLSNGRRPSTAGSRKSSNGNHSSSKGNNGNHSKPSSPGHSLRSERTVKKLRSSKALTIPEEGTTVSDVCRRMVHRRVDAALLTNSNGLLSGIVTDKDIATKVVAKGLKPEETFVSKIMTRNPIYISSDALAIEALRTMVHGKFRHLPVVENSQVVALLEITKCLHDATSRMEKAVEQVCAIAGAVGGGDAERRSGKAQYAFIETLRERMFEHSLSTIITNNMKFAMVSPSDPVCLAAKKMVEFGDNSVVVVIGGKPQGILTSRDILVRVVAQNLCPELTSLETVMTANPVCATLDTTILDALHLMHDRQFLHIPIVDHDGCIVACLDVLQITHAAISMLDGGHESGNEAAITMMHKFWDSPSEHPIEESDDTHSDISAINITSEPLETGKSIYPHPGHGNSFVFKVRDQKGHVHRIMCCSESLTELIALVKERLGAVNADEDNSTQLLYEDDEGDRVLLLTDSDLVGAVNHARSVGWKLLRLHLDDWYKKEALAVPPCWTSSYLQKTGWTPLRVSILAGAFSVAGMGAMVYLKR